MVAGVPSADRVATAIDGTDLYLTNEVFLYRVVGIVASRPSEMIEFEDCYSLDTAFLIVEWSGPYFLVPDLNHGLSGDLAAVELKHGRAQHVGAVRIAAGLDVRGAVIVLNAMPHRVRHVAAVRVLEPRLDLTVCAQHAW